MLRRLMVIGLVAMLVSTLAIVAAVQTSTNDAEAQVTAYEMNDLCRDYYTGLYKGTFTGSCPPGHQLLSLPDDYPISLCAGAYDGFLRAPNSNGDCPPATSIRIDVPSETPVYVCYNYYTGRLRLPTPYPNGTCGSAAFLATLPSGLDGIEDTYQTLGNIDIDVPAADGVLANDTGTSLTVTAFDAASANGGTVNVNPDGSFTYIPPMPNPNAFTGDDTFTYTVEDPGGASETVTVTIQVLNPVVWFVDADAIDPGDGRRQTPLNDISLLDDDGNDPDNPGDFIFLFEATSTYNAEFDLEVDQYLVGQEVDLAEILQQAIAGTTLQGVDPMELPPFIITPDADPSGDMPTLRYSDTALIMEDGSTGVGLTIVSDLSTAVVVETAFDTMLDRVMVYGGTDGDGYSAVDVVDAALTIVDSEIYGGNGDGDIDDITSSQLLGDFEDGYGGEAIFVLDSELTVTGSLVQGGDAGGVNTITSGTTLQGSTSDYGGNGGDGIFNPEFSQITINGESQIYGGDGSFGYYEGGWGGDGIGGLELPLISDPSAREVQGPPIEEEPPFIDVSGGSIIEGGDGADSEEYAGFGGVGIEAPFTIVRLTENSRATGGDGGGSQNYDGGDAGPGIVVGGAILLSELPNGSSLQGDPIGDITLLEIDSSTVEGGDGGATDGDFAGWGGDGIVVSFFVETLETGDSSLQGEFPASVIVSVNGSTITAGNGGSSSEYGGDGGWGIWLFTAANSCCFGGTSLQGPGVTEFTVDLNVTGSNVYGGAGGYGDDYGGLGGVGIANGYPFLFEPFSAESEGRQLELLDEDSLLGGNLTVVNSIVEGGNAGDAFDDDAGDGGPAILSVGAFSPVELQGNIGEDLSTTISDSVLQGGHGGSSDAYDGGYGGDAIAVLGMDLVVDQGTTAIAGNGGDGFYFGGNGGFGIYSEDATIIVNASTIAAGVGGASDDEEGGLGGEGIYGLYVDLTVENSSTVTGGHGGTADAGDGGIGGDGIYAEDSVVTVSGSTATAGIGGASENEIGGRGGHGVHVAPCAFCNTLTVTNSTVSGGHGGSSSSFDGGDGGEGVLVDNDNATITGSTIIGGHGGVGSLTDDDGLGAPAIGLHFYDVGDYGVSILTNTLTAGTGEAGIGPSLAALQEGTGSVCIDATANIPAGAFVLEQVTGTLGITQASTIDMGVVNNGVPVIATGTITPNCVVIQN